MRDIIEIVSILAFNSQNAAFHRKNFKIKNAQIGLKQAFFTKKSIGRLNFLFYITIL